MFWTKRWKFNLKCLHKVKKQKINLRSSWKKFQTLVFRRLDELDDWIQVIMQWSKKSAVAGCTRVSIGKKVFFFLLLADSQESSFLFLLLDGYRLSKSVSTYDKSIKTISPHIKFDWFSMKLKDLFQISLVRKFIKKGNATLLHHRSYNLKTSFTFCWSSKLM